MNKNPSKEQQITMRFLAEPSDINIYGKVHGGAVMKWIDQAAYACAAGWSGSPCVTVHVGGIRFHKPVLIGNIVEVHAKLIYTGQTSMHMLVNVRAGDPKTRQFILTTRCLIVFVALDDKGKPKDVPKWKPVAQEDLALQNYAEKMMELSMGIDEEIMQIPDEDYSL